MIDYAVRPLRSADRPWLRLFIVRRWGSQEMITRGWRSYPAENSGFVAERDGRPIGVITFEIHAGDCEITSLDSLEESRGIGSALLERAVDEARTRGCRRLWLITTNDNLSALKFYQKRGLRLVAVYPGAVDETRKLKPGIPAIGKNGLPLRDEIELEIRLS